MTRLEQLIARVAINKHTQTDIDEIRTHSVIEVERTIQEVCSNAPSWAITNINQSGVWGGRGRSATRQDK